MATVHQNDIEMEKALEAILSWDYNATGDLAPWDYDENTITGSGKSDAIAFVVEYGWKSPAKDDPTAFEAAFLDWYKGAQAQAQAIAAQEAVAFALSELPQTVGYDEDDE